MIYLFHNLEEWFVFKSSLSLIVGYTPGFIQEFLLGNQEEIIFSFGIAIITATILPIIISMFLFGEIKLFKVKVLIIIGFATFINAFSHISTSILLGFLSPGFISAIILCIPLSFSIFYFSIKYYQIKLRTYLSLALLSVFIFVFVISFTWSVGLLFH